MKIRKYQYFSLSWLFKCKLFKTNSSSVVFKRSVPLAALRMMRTFSSFPPPQPFHSHGCIQPYSRTFPLLTLKPAIYFLFISVLFFFSWRKTKAACTAVIKLDTTPVSNCIALLSACKAVRGGWGGLLRRANSFCLLMRTNDRHFLISKVGT